MTHIANGLFILGAWVFWGTYPAPFKSEAAKRANTDPFAFQCMKSACVFLTSWLILFWKPFYFTWWGLAGAALWIPSGLLYITSVQLTGVAFAAPVANGVQVIVSFCWGAFYFKEEVHNAWLSVLAMLIMIVGMVGVSYAVNYEKLIQSRLAKQKLLSINVHDDSKNGASPPDFYETDPLLQKQSEQEKYEHEQVQKMQKSDKTKKDKLNFILGVTCAVVGGVFGATQNVPLKKAHVSSGISYVFSFGIGAVIIISIFTFVYVLFRLLILKNGLPTVNLKISIVPGTMAGVLWSAGNVCNIYATLAYGTTVGFPLVMCNMMVAGLWGVFFYNEAPRRSMKALFILSCGTLLGGVTLLSFYG